MQDDCNIPFVKCLLSLVVDERGASTLFGQPAHKLSFHLYLSNAFTSGDSGHSPDDESLKVSPSDPRFYGPLPKWERDNDAFTRKYRRGQARRRWYIQ